MMICATFYLTDIMTDLIRIVSKLFIGAAGIAFGATLIKQSIDDAREVQEHGPSENWYED